MNDNISREKAIARFEEIKSQAESFRDKIYLDGVIAVLETIPSSDIHGRWVLDERYEDWADTYVCSICGRRALTDGDYRWEPSKYCPHCGAKMDEEEE